MPDPNELSQMEEVQEMRAKLDLFESALDASAEGLSFISPDGILLYVNQSFEAIHGVKASEVIGRHVTDVIKNTRMDIVAKTQLPEETEFLIDGSRRYVVSRIPVYRKGRMIGVLGKIDFPDLDKVKELANKIERLEAQLKYYRHNPRHGPGPRYTAEDIVAVSPRSAEAKATAMRVAPTHSTVLLLGESGVGKEVYAHAIHSLSLRAPGPFVLGNRRKPFRVGAVWLRGGRLHRSAKRRQSGQIRDGQPRHHLPGRNCRHASAGAGQASARAAGAGN